MLSLLLNNLAAGEGVGEETVVGRPLACVWGSPEPSAGPCGELGKLLSWEVDRRGLSIAFAIAIFDELPVQGIGTIPGLSEPLEKMERKTAPTEEERLLEVFSSRAALALVES